ncbi:MAG: secretin and TonB N-terminal domain-containing protein, partial [Steroidobacteraceae bacterium]
MSFAIAAGTPKAFHIEQQPLASALHEFARQSDRQILFSTEVVNAKRSSGIEGQWEPEVALRKLLQGTGLVYRLTTDDTILVDTPRAGETANVPVRQNSIRLARAGGSASSSAREERKALEGSAGNPEKRSELDLEEVIVTANRRRESLQDISMSITAVDSVEIDRRGLLSLGDYLNSVPSVLI